MAARDRHRGAELVRDVVHEALLLLEERRPLSGERLDVVDRATRRRACQTIARNIADMSGTSKSSPQSWIPSNASARIERARGDDDRAEHERRSSCGDQTRKP